MVIAALRASPPEAEQPEGFIESGHLPLATVITREELDSALRDAKRYRWIKANEHSELAAELCMEIPGEDWDAAIDAALSRSEEK
jgi:hypothetical protein